MVVEGMLRVCRIEEEVDCADPASVWVTESLWWPWVCGIAYVMIKLSAVCHLDRREERISSGEQHRHVPPLRHLRMTERRHQSARQSQRVKVVLALVIPCVMIHRWTKTGNVDLRSRLSPAPLRVLKRGLTVFGEQRGIDAIRVQLAHQIPRNCPVRVTSQHLKSMRSS